MPSVTRRVFLASLTCAPSVFPKSWDAPEFPSWSAEFIDKLLTDSPWAKQSDVRVDLDAINPFVDSTLLSFNQLEIPTGIGLPRTGSGVPGVGWPRGSGSPSGSRIPTAGGSSPGAGRRSGGATAEIFLTTRWASALPIRRAQALQRFGREALQHPEAVEQLNTPPQEYQIEIAGFPTTVVKQGPAKFADELKQTARLTLPGRRPISAISADMPEPGMHLMATLTFPRFEHLDTTEGYIDLSAAARGIKFRERFKLQQMVYAGNLEL